MLGSNLISEGNSQRILGDSIVGLISAYRGEPYIFDNNFIAENDGFIVTL